MTRFLPHACKGTSCGLVRLVAFTLIVLLALPLPATSEAVKAAYAAEGMAASCQIRFDSPPSGQQLDNAALTVQVTDSQGASVGAGVSVLWSYVNAYGRALTPSSTTDADGKAIHTIPYVSGERRTVTVTASVGGQSKSVDVQLGEALPSGFIALAPMTMNWSSAGSYCAAQGGKLPLINGESSLDSVSAGATIDGFGIVGDTWPAGLPGGGNYWTGTEGGGYPGESRIVYAYGRNVESGSNGQGLNIRVVCVR